MSKRMFRFSVLLTALFLSFASFTSCTFDADSTGENTTPSEISKAPLLKGTWESTFNEELVITETTVTKSSLNFDTPPVKVQNFNGTIKNVRLLTGTSGYITLLINESTEAYAPYIGKYYVLYFSDLSATSVKEAGPYKEGAESNGLATQIAAEEAYTVTNGYYSMSSTYTKKK